jgi:hypothetical protein
MPEIPTSVTTTVASAGAAAGTVGRNIARVNEYIPGGINFGDWFSYIKDTTVNVTSNSYHWIANKFSSVSQSTNPVNTGLTGDSVARITGKAVESTFNLMSEDQQQDLLKLRGQLQINIMNLESIIENSTTRVNANVHNILAEAKKELAHANILIGDSPNLASSSALSSSGELTPRAPVVPLSPVSDTFSTVIPQPFTGTLSLDTGPVASTSALPTSEVVSGMSGIIPTGSHRPSYTE